MRISMRGPGRPKKWNGRLLQWTAHIVEDDFEYIEQTRAKLKLSRAEFLHMVLNQANLNVLELQAKIKHLEEYISQLEKENAEKDQTIEKLLAENEKLKLENKALKLGSKSVVRDAIKFRAIAEKIEEGKTWKEICASAGFRDVDKIKDLLFAAFDAQKDENNEWPEVIEPRDVAEELEGFVLVKVPGVKHPVDYAVVKKGHEKAFLAEKKAEVEAPKVRDPAAEVATKLRAFLKSYELMKLDRRGEERAEKMLESFGKRGLKNLIKDYGFVTVFDVIYSDPQFKAVFLPLLESFTPKKKKEVVVDE